jgi:uncharacterized membrane protein YkvA (DUF1232 family)
MVCATIFGIAFMIVLAMPQSRMRDVMKNVLVAIACALYAVSPVDFMPEIIFGPLGLIDDLGAVIVGINAARQAASRAA